MTVASISPAGIAGNDQLEGRDELEEVTVEQAGANGIAPCDSLDTGFYPGLARFGFGHGDQTFAAQAGKVRGVGACTSYHETVEWGRRCVAAKCFGNRL